MKQVFFLLGVVFSFLYFGRLIVGCFNTGEFVAVFDVFIGPCLVAYAILEAGDRIVAKFGTEADARETTS